MEAPLHSLHVRFEQNLIFHIDRLSLSLTDAQLANALTIGQWPYHLLASGQRHAQLHMGTTMYSRGSYFLLIFQQIFATSTCIYLKKF
jgi:hypothetical protein